jgi:hypothetical protein
MAGTSKEDTGVIQKGFLKVDYNSLCGKLTEYRIDPELREAKKTVLPFVTGLRFSSLLIYAMRKILKGTKLKANWGVIIHNKDIRCSSECDIIVHKDDSDLAWDGQDDFDGPVMDFHFVPKSKVKAVVSCKASCVTQINQGMKDDVVKLRDYVSRVWLFAECCEPGKVVELRKKAIASGYEKLLYLYLLRPNGVGCYYDERVWFKFAESLKELAREGEG